MIVKYLISDLALWIRPVIHEVILVTGLRIYDDPGLPGGDPDLPETPLDGGIYIFILILLIYGIMKLRAIRQTQN